MVFSSLEFIYLFLPPVLLGFLVLRSLKLESAIIWWLISASLAFYAWWSPPHLLLLLGSVGFNYLVHKALLHKAVLHKRAKAVFAFGVLVNLSLLAVFKYADFLLENFNLVVGEDIPALGLILPLAISFYTFQQISFLHDTLVGNLVKCDFRRYVLFVTFFPQLIAGPIVMQKDTIPQFTISTFTNKTMLNILLGSTLFFIGLFKKIVIADGIAPVANAVFQVTDAGQAVPVDMAWFGALAYSFQIYFDFSGYCDMALGLALMFGIRLPVNFNSPYRALNIIDFWRRWHMTLSRFLRDYLYIPLGGNRGGLLGSKGNLMITMLLGGLWHGSGWNFMIWGGLHGLYLMINHVWSSSAFGQNIKGQTNPVIYKILSWLITIISVIIAWVFFRAETFSGAILLIGSMFAFVEVPFQFGLTPIIADLPLTITLLITMTIIVVAFPNAVQMTRRYRPILSAAGDVKKLSGKLLNLAWSPSPRWAVFTGLVACVGLIQIYRLNGLTEFIYFNF